jgi:acyl-CoA thioesterase I
MRRFLPAIAIALAVAVAHAEQPAKPWTFDAALLRPFWRSNVMEGESVLLMKANVSAQPKASLLFPPTRIIAVRNSAGSITYEEGRDYLWKPGTREISLPAGSRIVFKTPQQFRRPPRSQLFTLTHRDGMGEILFGGGHEYHDMQTVVTYEHEPGQWAGPTPTLAVKELPRTLAKLQAKQPLTLVVFGDSISTGCNASGWANTPPFQPPFQDMLAMNLEAVYVAKVTVKNFAVGGTGSAWGLQNIAKVAQSRPDLVVLAFGMNDAGGLPVVQYQANLKGMIDAIHNVQPEAEVILVASMLGNKDWTALQQPLFPLYRNALAQLCRSGVALADMTTVWTELFKHKQDWDLTGNGVNHPNDFGHRIYAQVLSALLVPEL